MSLNCIVKLVELLFINLLIPKLLSFQSEYFSHGDCSETFINNILPNSENQKEVIGVRLFSFKKNSKKGSLELSINSIVILILAITMLGLGLTFMNKLFGGTVEKFDKITGSIDQETKRKILDDLETNRVMLSPDTIKIKRGTKQTVYLGIKNNAGQDSQDFIIRGPNGLSIMESCSSIDPNGCSDSLRVETFEKVTLKSGETAIRDVRIIVGSNVPADIYTYDINVQSGDFDETRTLTVEVTI